jgi:hypothetical protein
MDSRHDFTTGWCPAPGQATTGAYRSVLTACALTVLALACPGCGDSLGKPDSQVAADLPEISTFLTKPSDRFLVELDRELRFVLAAGWRSPSSSCPVPRSSLLKPYRPAEAVHQRTVNADSSSPSALSRQGASAPPRKSSWHGGNETVQ